MSLKMCPTKEGKVLIVFDDMMPDIKATKNLSPIVTELSLSGRKLNSYLFLYHNLISKCLNLKFYMQHIILS